MSEKEFCYWLQGVLEVTDPKTLDEKQVAIIKEHLKLVFTKVTTEIKIDNDPEGIAKKIADALGKPDYTPYWRVDPSTTIPSWDCHRSTLC